MVLLRQLGAENHARHLPVRPRLAPTSDETNREAGHPDREVLHGVPIDVAKVAAYNLAPVSLVKQVLEAHADRPSTSSKDKYHEADSGKVISINRKR